MHPWLGFKELVLSLQVGNKHKRIIWILWKRNGYINQFSKAAEWKKFMVATLTHMYIVGTQKYGFWLIWFINQRALYNHALSGVVVVCAHLSLAQG